MGCSRNATECQRSHKPPKGKLADMHWTVQAQLIRRGGLKGGKRIEPSEVDGRISQLRAAAKAEEAAKKEDGRKAGGEPRIPQEFQEVDLTAAEEDLACALRGADASWGCDQHKGGVPATEVHAQVPLSPVIGLADCGSVSAAV